MSTENEPTSQTPPETPPEGEEATTGTQTTETEPKTGDEPKAEASPKKDDSSLLDDKKPTEPEFGADPVASESLKELLPEGFEPNEPVLNEFVEMINGAKSRADIVQGALKMLGEQQTQAESAIVDEWNETQNKWRDEVKNHPTLGGDKMEESLANALTVVDTYAGDAAAVKELFKLTGAGNSVHMVELLNNIAKAIPGESKPVEGSQKPTSRSRAEKLFG